MCSIISSGILKVSIVCVCGEREGGGGERERVYILKVLVLVKPG